MTKKITITLEENLTDELTSQAPESGKKKAQVIREALQDHFDMQAITKTVQGYEMGTLLLPYQIILTIDCFVPRSDGHCERI